MTEATTVTLQLRCNPEPSWYKMWITNTCLSILKPTVVRSHDSAFVIESRFRSSSEGRAGVLCLPDLAISDHWVCDFKMVFQREISGSRLSRFRRSFFVIRLCRTRAPQYDERMGKSRVLEPKELDIDSFARGYLQNSPFSSCSVTRRIRTRPHATPLCLKSHRNPPWSPSLFRRGVAPNHHLHAEDICLVFVE